MKITTQIKKSLWRPGEAEDQFVAAQRREQDLFRDTQKKLYVPRIHRNFDYTQIVTQKQKNGVVMRSSQNFWQKRYSFNVQQMRARSRQNLQEENIFLREDHNSKKQQFHITPSSDIQQQQQAPVVDSEGGSEVLAVSQLFTINRMQDQRNSLQLTGKAFNTTTQSQRNNSQVTEKQTRPVKRLALYTSRGASSQHYSNLKNDENIQKQNPLTLEQSSRVEQKSSSLAGEIETSVLPIRGHTSLRGLQVTQAERKTASSAAVLPLLRQSSMPSIYSRSKLPITFAQHGDRYNLQQRMRNTFTHQIM